jgi:putative peptidoglycan lipid II flippase
MVFTAVLGVLWAVYHSRQKFVWAELAPSVGAALNLALLPWALAHHGIQGAAWLGVLRAAVPVLLLLPGLGPCAKPDFTSPEVREAWRRIRPLLLGTAYYKTDPVVDRILSSWAGPGGLSLLYFGQQLFSASLQIINKAIAAPMVPILAQLAKTGNWIRFRAEYRRRAWIMALVTVAGFAAFLLVGQTVLRWLLLRHGGTTEEKVRSLWWIMAGLGGVLVGGGLGQVISTAFYARGDTTTPTRIGIFGFTLGIGFKIGGFALLGLGGIAIGTSLYYLLNVVMLSVFFQRDLRSSLQRQ